MAAAGWLTCEGITIPNAAQSLLGNVTVINQTSQSGYLTLYPDGVSQPQDRYRQYDHEHQERAGRDQRGDPSR